MLSYSHGFLLNHIPFRVPASILGDLFRYTKKDYKERCPLGLLPPFLRLG